MKYLIFCLIIITGCSHTSGLTGDHQPDEGTDVSYSVIYYIHADSDYLYHDSDGEPIRENSNVLATAFEVGEAAESGEVFIYYQRRDRKILNLFPRNNSRLFHYRNGQLINRIKYRHRDKKEDFLSTEDQLMNQYRGQNRTANHQNYFIYFGHEIPSGNGKGYHRSLPDIEVNTVTFARGIQNLLKSDTDRFSLVVLSTCNNGTPEMASALIPFTDVMLASPQNLHLSHFDTDKMKLLESEPEILPSDLARLMAENTFQRLGTDIQTTITLALYDLKDVRAYIDTLTSFASSIKDMDRFLQFEDNVDCAEFSLPDSERYLNGVEAWYSPARFGRQSGQQAHSGWGCKPGVY